MVMRPTKQDIGTMEFDSLESGQYVCDLKLKDCVVDVIKKVGDTYEKTGEFKPGIRFVFKVQDKHAYVCKSVASTTHHNGALFKLMQSCTDSLLKHVEWDESGFAADEDLFYQILQRIDGGTYLVTVKVNGDFNNFVDCAPFKSEENSSATVEATAMPEKIDFDSDEIPF